MKRVLPWILIFCLGLAGCGSAANDYTGFLICYMSEDGKNLLEAAASPEAAEDTTAWLDEMVEKLNSGSDIPAGGRALLGESMQISTVVNNSGVVTVDIGKGYYDLPVSEQVIVRAGLTKTFTQSSAINAVVLYVSGKPVTDTSGNELAAMTTKTFVDENSDGINNFRSSPMTLYFTDENGTELIPENRTAYYSINTPVEQAVLNELISGPSQSGHYRTLPTDLNVLNVTIQDDICYVNLDESFTSSVFDMDPSIQIYSIVDSIAAVCGVQSVAFSINGSSSVVFKDTIDLDQIFSPDFQAE